jgi:MYXO-CTERM domain-containing protein
MEMFSNVRSVSMLASAMLVCGPCLLGASTSWGAPITNPDDPRSWQGATVETFRALLGYSSRQALVDDQILDDGIFPTPIDLGGFTASSTPCTGDTPSAPTGTYIGTVEGCSGYSYDPLSYAYTCGSEPLAIYTARGNCLDMNWLQDGGDNQVASGNVWDLGGPSNQVAVFPIVDHAPLPGEAMEYSVYLSNNPTATSVGTDGETSWVLAHLDRVYLEGWHPGWIVDGFTTVWRLPDAQTFRYANVVAGGPGALHRDGDDEIDAVIGLTFDGDPVLDGCTYTRGYWRNHHGDAPGNRDVAWPIAEDTELCGQTWFDILRTPARGDAWYIVAAQYIAARLNVAGGASAPVEVRDALSDAEDFLVSNCAITRNERQAALAAKDVLDDYNNGLIGPGHCDDTASDGESENGTDGRQVTPTDPGIQGPQGAGCTVSGNGGSPGFMLLAFGLVMFVLRRRRA